MYVLTRTFYRGVIVPESPFFFSTFPCDPLICLLVLGLNRCLSVLLGIFHKVLGVSQSVSISFPDIIQVFQFIQTYLSPERVKIISTNSIRVILSLAYEFILSDDPLR